MSEHPLGEALARERLEPEQVAESAGVGHLADTRRCVEAIEGIEFDAAG